MDFVSGIALATSDLRNRLKETPAASAVLLTGIIPLSKPLPVCSEKAMTEKKCLSEVMRTGYAWGNVRPYAACSSVLLRMDIPTVAYGSPLSDWHH